MWGAIPNATRNIKYNTFQGGIPMSVNGITGAANTYEAYQANQTNTKAAEENTSKAASEKKDDKGVVYESSKESTSTGKTYTQNTN